MKNKVANNFFYSLESAFLPKFISHSAVPYYSDGNKNRVPSLASKVVFDS
jgi:hypothetical protein